MTGTSAAAGTGRPHAQWPKTAVRVTFGAVWLIDAILKWGSPDASVGGFGAS